MRVCVDSVCVWTLCASMWVDSVWSCESVCVDGMCACVCVCCSVGGGGVDGALNCVPRYVWADSVSACVFFICVCVCCWGDGSSKRTRSNS